MAQLSLLLSLLNIIVVFLAASRPVRPAAPSLLIPADLDAVKLLEAVVL